MGPMAVHFLVFFNSIDFPLQSWSDSADNAVCNGQEG